MSNAKTNTYKLTGLGILTAIIVVLQVFTTFVHFGPFSITLALIPIVVGAAMYGKGAGAYLGAVFSVVVVIMCITGGDPGGAGPPGGVDHDEQFHQIVVGRVAGGLDEEGIGTPDVFLELREDLPVGEKGRDSHTGILQRRRLQRASRSAQHNILRHKGDRTSCLI